MDLWQSALYAAKLSSAKWCKSWAELRHLIEYSPLNTITTLSKTIMILWLQISADDIAVKHWNLILEPVLNGIKASLGESAKERKLPLVTWSTAKKWDPKCTQSRWLWFSDEEERASSTYKYTKNEKTGLSQSRTVLISDTLSIVYQSLILKTYPSKFLPCVYFYLTLV